MAEQTKPHWLRCWPRSRVVRVFAHLKQLKSLPVPCAEWSSTASSTTASSIYSTKPADRPVPG